MKEVTIFVGKSKSVKVDLDNLLSTDVAVLGSIPYGSAKKHPEFISAMEVCIEDCLDTVIEVVNEDSYKLAIDHMIIICGEEEKEEEIMADVTVVAVEEVVTNNTNNQEEEEMKEAVAEFVNETMEDVAQELNMELNTLNDKLFGAINSLDQLSGFKALRLALIDDILHSEGQSITDIARKCRKRVDDEIKFIYECGQEKYFKDAVALKAIFYTKDGEEEYRDIFSIFASGVTWVYLKACSLISNYQSKYELMNHILKGIRTIAGAVKTVAVKAIKGVKIGFSIVYGVAAKGLSWVANIITSFFMRVTDWAVVKFSKVTNKNVEDDFDNEFFEDEEDGIVIIEQ